MRKKGDALKHKCKISVLGFFIGYVCSVDKDTPGIGSFETGYTPECGCLSAATRAK